VVQIAEINPKKTFTDFLRARFKGLIEPISAFLNKLGILPNTMTLIGLAGQIGAAVLLAFGYIQWGGLALLLMAPMDALDGTMARLRGKPSRFGGFLDSVVDRFAELALFAGLLVHFVRLEQWLLVVITYLAAAGSVMVSYSRARGESLGFNVKVGLLTRVERYIVIIACFILNIPQVAVWILAVLTNVTAIQRIMAVHKQAAEQNDLLI